MRNLTKLAAAIACTVISGVVFAGGSYSAEGSYPAEGSRHADAHVHGSGHFNFAVQGDQVHLELETPGFDILGFETIASEEQHHQLEDAMEKLKQPELWSFTAGANCQLKTVSVSNGDEHRHDEKGHAEHDVHEQHGDHEEHGAHKEHAEQGHMDIEAAYVYECANIRKLANISTTLFSQFRHSEKLEVQGFTAKGQVAAVMTRAKPEVKF